MFRTVNLANGELFSDVLAAYSYHYQGIMASKCSSHKQGHVMYCRIMKEYRTKMGVLSNNCTILCVLDLHGKSSSAGISHSTSLTP